MIPPEQGTSTTAPSPSLGAIDPRAGSRNRWTAFAVCVFLAVATWIVFGQTIHHAFVNFDDDVYVYKNPTVASGLSSRSVAWAFTRVHSSNWHPVTWLSHMLDCQWYGLNPGGPHFTNVLLHTATAILLFLVLWQMTRLDSTLPAGSRSGLAMEASPSPSTAALWCSAFVAAVFAVHPLRVESVAWIAERKDVLSGLFFMLTLMAWVRYVRRPKSEVRSPKEIRSPKEVRNPNAEFLRSPFYWLALLFFALGLMSKPMLVTLPFVLLLLDWWPLRRVSGIRFQVSGEEGSVEPLSVSRRRPVWNLVLEKIPFLLLSVAVCVVTVLAQSEAMSSLPLPVRLGNAVVSYTAYLKQMIYPVGLAVLYPYPESGLPIAKIIGSAVVLLIISAVVAMARRKQPWLWIGWLWYLGMLVPAIGIVQVGSQAQADRYTYLPQIGLYIALTWAAAALCVSWRYSRIVLGGAAAVVLGALMFGARTQVSYWRNSESLWTHTLACTSDSLTAHINFGNALLDAGKMDDAMAHYQTALQLRPDDPDAHVSFGYALAQKGLLDAAAIHFQKALAVKPNDALAQNDLGHILAQKGNVDEAIAHFQKALAIKPDYAEASYNLANAFFEKGKMDEAIGRYQAALQINPNYPEACFNLGNTYFQKGNADAAIAQYQRALQIKPDYARAAFNLGAALTQKGKTDDAIVQFQNAVRLMPDNAEAHYLLATTLLQKGREDEAITHFQKAVQLKPDYAEAQNNLAWELATCPQASLRNGSRAVELALHANQLSGGNDVDILDTLAAAYAEAGRFDDAIHSAQKAIDLARTAKQPDQLEQLNRELALYQAGHPFHRENK